MSNIHTLVIPGTRIPPNTLAEFTAGGIGDGLYEFEGDIYASRVGYLDTIEVVDQTTVTSSTSTTASPPLDTPVTKTRTLIVRSSLYGGKLGTVPVIGQTILGTVTRISSKFIAIDISVLESNDQQRPVYLEEPFRGTLRSQDIWPAEDKDAPVNQLYMAMRPGDLVRARIIGVGDVAAGFLLSTAVDFQYGVVFAKCATSGEPMVAVSWNEMICPRTGVREPRKPAKPTRTDNV